MDPSAEVLLESRVFRVVRQTYRDSQGRPHVRDTVQHPGAVVLLPLLDDDRVCLIRNYRVAVEQWLLELPAGTLEPGEDPQRTAERELAEETGYRATRVEKLCEFYMSPGILNERMRLYLATGLRAGETELDDGEQIESVVVPWREALAMVGDGRIQDAKSLLGILWYEQFRRGASRSAAD